MSVPDHTQVHCPCCGELTDIEVVPDAAGADQDYTEDCTVCCRPMVVHITWDEDGLPSATAEREGG